MLERYGIRKTTVEEIARACGISKGAFYLFYRCKEELFLEICESVENDYRLRIFDKVFEDGIPPRQSFRCFLMRIFTRFEETPLLRNVSQEDLAYMLRKLPREKTAVHLGRDNSFSEEFYAQWKRKGRLAAVNPKGFAGIMKLAFFLMLHKQEFTDEEFLATRNLYIAVLCDYLFHGKEK